MAQEPITKSPPGSSAKPAGEKGDRLRADTPQIPGVSGPERGSVPPASEIETQRVWRIGSVVVGVLLIGFIISWWVRNRPPEDASIQGAKSESAAPSAPSQAAPSSSPAELTTIAAKAEEVSQPWSWKKFTFVRPFTNQNIPAIVVRLPSGELWAFSLQEPSGRCELEYVTDLDKIESQYGYHATHPMVGNPCNGTLYDPLKVGALGGDVLVRGEIVKGTGLRPPISINVTVSGSSVIADRIE